MRDTDTQPAETAGEAALAALVGSRICHDLISPIGAIGNGVELLMMEAAAKSPEMALIADSVAQANVRIRFFRVAFGLASPGQRIGRTEVAALLADLMRGGRIAADWQSPADLTRAEVKTAFLAFMACESALPFGGRIAVLQEGGAWTVTAQAARLRIDGALWQGLARGDLPAVAAAQVHFALLPRAAAAAGRVLSVETGETGVRIAF